jgi:Predicted proline hydroxylase
MSDQSTQASRRRPLFHGERNAATRIDVFEEMTPTAEAALRAFFRRHGAPQYMDEVVIPTLRIGDAQIFCAVRDRPWPPWGLGARTISAYCEVHTIAPESWAISPVLVAPEDNTNVGLMCALFGELLEALAVSETAEVCYLVVEGSVLLDHILRSNGFRRDDDVFLTEHARYFTYRANVHALRKQLGLDRLSTPELLMHEFTDEFMARNAFFHHCIQAAERVDLNFDDVVTEIIPLPRGGHASKPGGVPGGSGTGLGTDESHGPFEDNLPYVALADFLGDVRGALLDHVTTRVSDFLPATVAHRGAGDPEVDDRMRRASTLDDIGSVRSGLEDRLRGALPGTLERLAMEAFPVGHIEMQITASRDGGYYRMHRDADAESTRMVSFVYFFHREPRSFSGGELRLFDDRGVSERAHADNSQLLSPRQDTVVFFPSHIPHELLPVRVPSGSFPDSRFTINGWIHRAAG